MTGYYSRGGVPSLGNERHWCSHCQEYTIRKHGVCVRTGCGEELGRPKYRRPPPMRQTRKGPRRKTDPVTGMERRG